MHAEAYYKLKGLIEPGEEGCKVLSIIVYGSKPCPEGEWYCENTRCDDLIDVT